MNWTQRAIRKPEYNLGPLSPKRMPLPVELQLLLGSRYRANPEDERTSDHPHALGACRSLLFAYDF